jgi:hypothetical protein
MVSVQPVTNAAAPGDGTETTYRSREGSLKENAPRMVSSGGIVSDGVNTQRQAAGWLAARSALQASARETRGAPPRRG